MEDHDPFVKVAFLGPLGTYTHQLSLNLGLPLPTASKEASQVSPLTNFVKQILQRGGAGVFDALSPSTPLGVVPQENTIFGNVVETYDILRQSRAGEHVFVVGEVTLQVQHCLLVREGVRLEQIDTILSHEQALGQCKGFLSKLLPSASLVKTPSTAAAAKDVLSPNSPRFCAAICSKLCATLFPGLEVLHEGIQDENINFTRFYIIGTSLLMNVPALSIHEHPRHALIRLQLHQHEPAAIDATSYPTIIELLTSLQLCATRIDRRPAVQGLPFYDVYFVEVQQKKRVTLKENGTSKELSWVGEVKQGIERVEEMGAVAQLLGIW